MYLDKPFIDWDEDEKTNYIELQYKAALEASEKFNSYISLRDWEDIYKDYEEADGPLKGLLLPVKDNISTKGMLTTCGSKMLSSYKPIYDAHVIEKLEEAGAVILGKTNMDEFAMGNTGETSYFGPTRNPWDIDRVPGGSSSGSAVAVTWKGIMALGSDTGGSIRQPASYTGIIGLKPTYGLVSRYGLISYAESLEQIGPMARYSRDLALLYYFLTSPDERDITMVEDRHREMIRENLLKILKKGFINSSRIENYIFAYSSKLVDEAEDPVKKIFYSSIEFLEELGASTIDIDAEFLKAALPAYYIIAMVEASSNLARYDGSNYGLRRESTYYWDAVVKSRVEGFGEEVKRRIIMGGFASSKGYEGKYYIRSLKVRRWIKNSLVNILSQYPFFILPTTPSLPPKLGEISGPEGYIQDIYTVVPNLTGHPSISIPAGYVHDLPIGIQFIGNYFSDPDLIFIASLFEGTRYNPEKIPRGD